MKHLALTIILSLMLLMAGVFVTQKAYAHPFVGQYIELPLGYQWEYWESGPTIVEIATGMPIELYILRQMFPYHHFRPLHHPPHFVRDWRIPSHRLHWYYYVPVPRGGMYYHPVPPPRPLGPHGPHGIPPRGPHRGMYHTPPHHMHGGPHGMPPHGPHGRGHGGPPHRR